MADVIQDITNFIFLEDSPQPADVIFIPGSTAPEPMERAAALWKEGYAPLMIPSGRYSVRFSSFPGASRKRELYPGPYRFESEFYADIAQKNGVDPAAVLPEPRATYTMQNAVFSRELADQKGIAVHRALICCKNVHARRAFMYYRYAFPEAELLVIPVEIMGIRRDNWFRSSKGIRLVLGELERCGSQFTDLIPAFCPEKEA